MVKLYSCTAYTVAGTDLGSFPRYRLSYASPRIVSNGIDMFSFSPPLEWWHHHYGI
jgi:hypothetical protein